MRNTRFLFSAAIGERTACKGGKKHRTSFPIRYLHSLLPQAAYSDRLHRVSLPELGTSSRNGRLRMESVTLHRLDGVITNREPSLRDHRLKGSGTLASDRSDRSKYPVIYDLYRSRREIQIPGCWIEQPIRLPSIRQRQLSPYSAASIPASSGIPTAARALICVKGLRIKAVSGDPGSTK